MLYLNCGSAVSSLRLLEKGKLPERVGRKAVSLNLSGDKYGCLVAGPKFIFGLVKCISSSFSRRTTLNKGGRNV